jgi:hypothetical protein
MMARELKVALLWFVVTLQRRKEKLNVVRNGW